jgi:murein DD-endopeptidase MepM/ murein hydrolase activator NlpD
VPAPFRPRTPGPLANLPRPLDERERGRGRGRRVASIVGLAAIVGVTAVVAHAILPALVPPVGEVAGAVATASPDPVLARATAVPSLAAAGSVVPSGAPSAAPSAAPTLPPTGPASPPAIAITALDRPDGYRAPVATPLPPEALTAYRWPLAHGRITLPFGPTAWGTRVVDGELFHDGIDLATFCGDRVVAAHAGKVIAVGRHFDDAMGWVGNLQPYYRRLDARHLWYELPIVVVVADGNGYRSMYAHFSDVAVKRGQMVKAGQFLGHEGRTGRATGCHVHYGLFSPLETKTFAVEPAVVKRMKVPRFQTARIDPLLVLPDRNAPPVSSASPVTDQPISP